MRKIFGLIWEWLRGWFRRRPAVFTAVNVEELPDRLDAATIYIAGEGEHRWFAAMLCPCGCGEILHMNLQEHTRPRWSVVCHSDETISLSPSVWRRVGCRSHFFFRQGQVVWCPNDDWRSVNGSDDGRRE